MTSEESTERTLLIVDDEADILEAVERLFRKDYRVLTALSVDDALEIVEHDLPQVVLSDQRMPTRSGVEFLAELRQAHPEIVRVLLTGYSNIDHVIDAINEGHVYRYVSKPWEPMELKVIVAQCFDYWDGRQERASLVESLRQANAQLEQRNVQLQEANEELKTLDRMKSVFMEVVSHELNTPIAVILGYAFLLRRELDDLDNEVVAKALNGIDTSGARLKSISSRIFKMLSDERPHTLALEELDLADFFDDLRDHVSPFLEKRHQTLVTSIEPDAATIKADRAKLHDIFFNLVMNAIKFSHDGQEISITVADAPDEMVLATVKDRGIGIHEEDISQIFDAFFSTFNSQYHSSGDFEFGKRGIGLGLSVARRFAQMHGGEISVESEKGGGSTFSVRLPRDPSVRAGL